MFVAAIASIQVGINALSGWNSISTNENFILDPSFMCINALSGWNSISTIKPGSSFGIRMSLYQCPFGLELHFYFFLQDTKIFDSTVSMPFRAGTPFLPYNLPHWGKAAYFCINALSGWNSISTVPLRKPRFYAVSGACFCRYLSEYSDNGHFSCMLTI